MIELKRLARKRKKDCKIRTLYFAIDFFEDNEANMNVYRFILKGKPKKDNPQHFEWQNINIVAFVGANFHTVAEDNLKKRLEKIKIIISSFEKKDILIEAKIYEEGGIILEKYLEAKLGKVIFPVFSVEEFFSDKESPPLLFPKIDEPFFDKVIQDLGGIRFPIEISRKADFKNADYLLDNYIFELKFLENDPYDTNKKRLANLLKDQESSSILDEENLDTDIIPQYKKIVSKPIKTHVEKASKQIKNTRDYLKRQDFLGGLILVNHAATSIAPRSYLKNA